MPSPTKSKIYFFQETPVTIRNKTALKRFIKSIIKKEGHSLNSINYVFCTDKRILEINRRYLKHDYYTDIITFQLSGKKQPIEAEIYISVERLRENALTLGVSLTNEVLRVMFHGILHLCGYKDKTQAQKKEIRQKEDQYLKSYRRSMN